MSKLSFDEGVRLDFKRRGERELRCDLLEHEGADCRWLGDRSSGSDDRSMAIAIHSLLAAFASSVY